MRQPLHTLLLFSALALGACGDDAGSMPDAGTRPGIDASESGDLPTTCTGSCATTTLKVEFGATTRDFDRAFFGLTSPAMSESGEWEIYIENNAGTDTACPTESSPTPLYLLTLAGFRAPSQFDSASASATLVDFEGALLTDSPISRSTANTVSWRAADLCIACAEGSEADRPERMVAFDVDATFAQGTISGHGFAKHCDSLDSL